MNLESVQKISDRLEVCTTNASITETPERITIRVGDFTIQFKKDLNKLQIETESLFTVPVVDISNEYLLTIGVESNA
jgi:hypothetical protein